MNTPRSCLWRVLTLSALLAGCQHTAPPPVAPVESRPAAGEVYVTFVRDMMAESAHLDAQSGDGVEHSEMAVRAVSAWRGAAQDGGAAQSGDG